jgi:hypothetical protein
LLGEELMFTNNTSAVTREEKRLFTNLYLDDLTSSVLELRDEAVNKPPTTSKDLGKHGRFNVR